MDIKEEIILKVSSSKAPGYAKRVAGAMLWQLREHGFVKVRAVKRDAVNSAVKALAICNQRVASANILFGMELFFSKTEKQDVRLATAIEILIQETDIKNGKEFVEYRVSGKEENDRTSALKLAEAIAVPVKEGKGVSLKCIGGVAVYKAILASTIARGLIYTNGMQAFVIPSWESVLREGGSPISLLRLDFAGKKSV